MRYSLIHVAVGRVELAFVFVRITATALLYKVG